MRDCLEKPFFKENQKRKRKGLARAIASTNRRTNLSETVHKTILERATEETGSMEHGEIIPSVPQLRLML